MTDVIYHVDSQHTLQMSRPSPKFVYRFLTVLLLLVGLIAAGCRPPQNIAEMPLENKATPEILPTEPEPEQDITFVLRTIDESFGTVERDTYGNIIGVDLAAGRTSATDAVLKLALTLPNLKKFRLAGGTISAEAFAGLKLQTNLEELFLQDMSIRDDEFLSVVSALPNLKRLTLRRLSNVSDVGMIPLFQLPALRQLALIEMPLTGAGLQNVDDTVTLTAFDVRDCAQLVPEDYKHLLRLPKLVDLKIGGFAINDQCLEIIAQLPALKGLTLDDTMISAKGFETFATDSLSADTLETLVLNRNMALTDDALVALGNFPRLRRIILGDAMVTGTFIVRLAEEEQKRPKFNDIALRKTFLTEEAMDSFKQYPELQSLQITGIVLSREGIDILLSLSSLERLDLTDCFLDEEALRHLQGAELPMSLKVLKY